MWWLDIALVTVAWGCGYGSARFRSASTPKPNVQASNRDQGPYRSMHDVPVGLVTEGSKVKLLDVIPWAWRDKERNLAAGYVCPKCLTASSQGSDSEKTDPTFCVCDDHAEGHFHFNCPSCKYTAIMKTADKGVT